MKDLTFGAEWAKLKKRDGVAMKVASHFWARHFVKQMFREAQPESDLGPALLLYVHLEDEG